ncbi:MAG: NAD(P)H-hydrate dehydratase [Acutalibacteraceae bacterium]
MKILTAREMRLVEASAVAEGLDYLRLMENAGSAAARVIRSRYAVSGRRVTVLCGRGNNGGDGFVIARKLLEAGAEVTVALLCGYPTGLESGEMFSRIQNAGIEIVSLDNQPYAVSDAVKSAALLVDAVYGIGFHGELPVHLRTVFRMANAAPVPIVAVDVPSGVNCDTGEADPDALVAEVTVTFTAMKPGLLDDRCAAFAGCVEVVAIGIDERLMEQFPSARTVIDAGMVKACFSLRAADSHKGTYGTLLNVCGSYGMAGAAVLAMRAALRCGVGLLRAAVPRSLYPILSCQVPEAVFLPLPETGEGQLALRARAQLRSQAAGASAMLIGCGLGTGEEVRGVVFDLLRSAECPTVLDADGINAVCGHIDILKTVKAPLVLTPHPGEMARLIGCTTAEVQAHRLEIAQKFVSEYPAVLVLKGSQTVIAAPQETLLVNPTGNPGMATGGSGDVLAGMIASLLAQGLPPYAAAMCGAYLHGQAGDNAAARLSQHAMLPSDMIDELGGLFLNLENRG